MMLSRSPWLPKLHFKWCLSICLLVTSWSLAEVTAAQESSDSEKSSPLKRLGFNRNEAIHESSGLAGSSIADAFWTINDSGDKPRIFLLKTDGTLLKECQLDGAKNVDWEALAELKLDNRRWLIVADVGDNRRQRESYQLYLLPEPEAERDDAAIAKVAALRVEFKYLAPANKAEPARTQNFVSLDCEAAAVDPSTQSLWLIEKRNLTDAQPGQPVVYSIGLPLEAMKEWISEGRKPVQLPPVEAKPIGRFPIKLVTGMSFSPDGQKLIARNYLNAHLYRRQSEQTWQQVLNTQKPQAVALPMQWQGEAICFTPDSKSVVITSEHVNQPIWQVDLPKQ